MMASAYKLYERARTGGWLHQILSALTGREGHLLPLAAIRAACAAYSTSFAGTRSVPIAKIRGSVNRYHDFDADFHPLHDHIEDRWLNIATAWQFGVALPPVDLIQVGENYFVSDGHHRISVARAMGQEHIEAMVTTWQAGDHCADHRSIPDAIQTEEVSPGKRSLLFIQAILLALLAVNVALAWFVPLILRNISAA